MCNPFRAPCMTRFLARILVRRPCGDPSGMESSPRRSLQDLALILIRRSCGHPGVQLAWSCTGPYEKILWRSCWNHLRGLCMILCRSLWKDLAEILVKFCLAWSCTGPSEQILTGSWWNPLGVLAWWEDLVEILFKSSLRGPCVEILKMLCVRGACMEVLLGCP